MDDFIEEKRLELLEGDQLEWTWFDKYHRILIVF